MAKMLIDRDPLTGEAVWYEYHAVNDSATITHTQDVEPIIEMNRLLANNSDYTKHGINKDWWHYAKVPNIVYVDWLTKKGVDIFNPGHKKELFALLNSPEYAYLKTTGKHHGG